MSEEYASSEGIHLCMVRKKSSLKMKEEDSGSVFERMEFHGIDTRILLASS